MPVAQESIPPAENVGPAQRKKKKKLVWARLLMVEMALKKKKSYNSQTRVIVNQ